MPIITLTSREEERRKPKLIKATNASRKPILFCNSQSSPHTDKERRAKLMVYLSVKLVGNIALLSDLTLCASKRVVLRENGDGS